MFVIDRDRYEWCERQFRALWMRAQDNGLHNREEACRNSGFSSVPCYTRSIDDALTLVPEHYSYELTQSAVEPPRLARARLWDWRRSPTMSDPGNEWKSEGNRPLAIALCIASLRARAALKATTDSAAGAG